jgi:hydrogenase-4 membrane subunit HyfE
MVERIVLLLAGLLLVAGPLVLLLGGGLTVAVLVFSLGVILLGVHSLVERRDRAVGYVLIFVGSISVLADIARALLA